MNSPSTPSSATVIDRLRQRKIVQWCLAYVTAAWLLAQVLEVVTEPWGIPSNWIRMVHVVLATGLPVTAVLAWHHGERGRQRVTGLELLAIAGVLFVAGLVITVLRPLDGPGSGEQPPNPSLAHPDGESPRLAVLAFTNLGAPEDDFFADGITAELNARLSGLQGLSVISRSSALMFRESGKSARQIGSELGADYVLAGTIRWERNESDSARIRVSPELIRVADDAQVWAANLDRTFEEVLSIQANLAGLVVSELDLVLSAPEKRSLERRPTANPLAYQAYLKGVQALPGGHAGEQRYRQSRMLFQQALNLDPAFALAWVRRAEADLGLYWFGYDVTEARLAQAREAIDHALKLSPELSEARMLLGEYFYRLREYDRALAEFSSVYPERPNDSNVISRLGFLWRRQGLLDQGLEALARSVDLDPLHAYGYLELAWTHLYLGHVQQALELVHQAREIDPTEEWTYLIGAYVHWYRGGEGDLEAARDWLSAFPDPRSTYPVYLWVLQHLFEGDPDSALARVRNAPIDTLVMQQLYLPVSMLEGQLLIYLGRADEGRPLLMAAAETLAAETAANPVDFRMPLSLARARTLLGNGDGAEPLLDIALGQMSLERDAMIGPDVLYEAARVYALNGQSERALDLLVRLHSIPSAYAGFLISRQPDFASLRDAPRFQSLLISGP